MSNDSVMVNESVNISCNSSGFPMPTYAWYKGNTLLQNGSSSSFVIVSAMLTDIGSYYCVALNGYTNKTSSRKSLYVWCKQISTRFLPINCSPIHHFFLRSFIFSPLLHLFSHSLSLKNHF